MAHAATRRVADPPHLVDPPAIVEPPYLVEAHELSPERQHLSEAIAEFAQLAKFVQDVTEAIDRLDHTVYDAYDAAEDAEATVRQAERDHPYFVAAQELGESTGDLVPLAKSRLDLDTARRTLETARARRDALEATLVDARHRFDDAKRHRDNAVGEVVSASLEVRQLIAAYNSSKEQTSRLATALAAINKYLNLELSRWDVIRQIPPDFSVADPWKAALAALEQDASVPLPEAK